MGIPKTTLHKKRAQIPKSQNNITFLLLVLRIDSANTIQDCETR